MANEIQVTVTGDAASGTRAFQAVRKGATDTGKHVEKELSTGAAKAEAAVTKSTQKAALATIKVGDAGKKAGKELGSGVEKGAKDAEEALDKTKKKAKETSETIGDAGDEVGKGLGAQAGGVQDALTEQLDGLKGVAGPAGAAVGGLLMAGIVASIQQGRINTVLGQSLDPAVASRAGALAGDLWARGFGQSMEEVAEAVKSLFQQGIVDSRTTKADLQEIGRQAIVTAEITGERVHDIGRAVSQMLRTGMVKSAKEGFDLIVRAQQVGLNKSEDLLVALEEYGTQFRKVGVDGQQALGLISQALQGGARDSDTAADAIKEFALITAAGGAEAASALEALGLDADETFGKLAAGGKPAASALNSVLINLRQVRDPADRARLALALFGTKAEDLGDALFEMDLSSASTDFAEFEDAAKKAADALEKDMSTTLEKVGRAGVSAAEGLATVSAAMSGQEQALVDIGVAAAGFFDLLPDGTAATEEQAAAAERQAAATESGTQTFYDQAAALDRLIDRNRELAGVKISAIEAELGFEESLDSGREALEANGTTLDRTTEKGRANSQALLDIADSTHSLIGAMNESEATADQMNAVMGRSREQFLALARQMGLSKAEAEALARQLGLMSRPYGARFSVDASSAYANLFGLEKALYNATRPRSVSVNVNYQTGGPTWAASAHGGIVGAPLPTAAEGLPHRAAGGPSGGTTLVGEQGPEFVSLAPGSRVHSNPDTERMLAGAGGGSPRVVLEIRSGGTLWDDMLVESLRRAVNAQGGDVQLVLGSGRR